MTRAIKQKIPLISGGVNIGVHYITNTSTLDERTLDYKKARGHSEVVFVLNKTTGANVDIFTNLPIGYLGFKFTVIKEDATAWTINQSPNQDNKATDNMFNINGDDALIDTVYSTTGRAFESVTFMQYYTATKGVCWFPIDGNGTWHDGANNRLLVNHSSGLTVINK